MTHRCVIILAGGASSRMGSPKAWLDWHGRPLLLHVIDVCSASADEVVVVTRDGLALPPLPIDVVLTRDDPALEAGPLVGVLAGLRACSAPLAYLGSVDAPRLTAAHVGAMLQRLEDAPAHDAMAPRLDARRIHPLASALRVAAALPVCERLVQTGERSVRALFAALSTLSVELDDPTPLYDCNTPAQYAASVSCKA